MNNNLLFLLFSFWGDLLVSASVISADKSSRSKPAETAKRGEWQRGSKKGRERLRGGGGLSLRPDSPSKPGMSLLAKDQ